jgi:hypothetical protein
MSDEERRSVGYSSFKELSNFYFFLETFDLGDLAYDAIGVGKQKKCIFRFFDSKFKDFCLENSFDISDFNNFLKVISLYSIQEEVLFQKYDDSFKEDFSVEKIINSEMRFIVKLIN